MDPIYIPIVAILMPLVLVPTIARHEASPSAPEVGTSRAAQVDGGPDADAHAAGPGRGRGHRRHRRRRAGRVGARRAPDDPLVGAVSPSAIPSAVPAIAWGCAVLISVRRHAHQLEAGLDAARGLRKSSELADSPRRLKPVFDPDAFDVVSSRG